MKDSLLSSRPHFAMLLSTSCCRNFPEASANVAIVAASVHAAQRSDRHISKENAVVLRAKLDRSWRRHRANHHNRAAKCPFAWAVLFFLTFLSMPLQQRAKAGEHEDTRNVKQTPPVAIFACRTPVNSWLDASCAFVSACVLRNEKREATRLPKKSQFAVEDEEKARKPATKTLH